MNNYKNEDNMTREEFTNAVTELVTQYIETVDRFDNNPQLRVNPVTFAIDLATGNDLLEEIAYSNEAIEEAAAAERPASEDAADYQAAQNPDFYPLRSLVRINSEGEDRVDEKAVENVAANYNFE